MIPKYNWKNAMGGLIHVMLEKEDFSNGAIAWYGIDFATKGGNHPKAKEQGISITKDLWDNFIDVCDQKSGPDNIPRLYRNTTNIMKNEPISDVRRRIPFLESYLNYNLTESIKEYEKVQ